MTVDITPPGEEADLVTVIMAQNSGLAFGILRVIWVTAESALVDIGVFTLAEIDPPAQVGLIESMYESLQELACDADEVANT